MNRLIVILAGVLIGISAKIDFRLWYFWLPLGTAGIIRNRISSYPNPGDGVIPVLDDIRIEVEKSIPESDRLALDEYYDKAFADGQEQRDNEIAVHFTEKPQELSPLLIRVFNKHDAETRERALEEFTAAIMHLGIPIKQEIFAEITKLKGGSK